MKNSQTQIKEGLKQNNKLLEILLPIAKKLDCPYNGEKLTNEETQIALYNIRLINQITYTSMVKLFEENKKRLK